MNSAYDIRNRFNLKRVSYAETQFEKVKQGLGRSGPAVRTISASSNSNKSQFSTKSTRDFYFRGNAKPSEERKDSSSYISKESSKNVIYRDDKDRHIHKSIKRDENIDVHELVPETREVKRGELLTVRIDNEDKRVHYLCKTRNNKIVCADRERIYWLDYQQLLFFVQEKIVFL